MTMPDRVFVIGGGWKSREYLACHHESQQLYKPTEYIRADTIRPLVDALESARRDLKDALTVCDKRHFERRIRSALKALDSDTLAQFREKNG